MFSHSPSFILPFIRLYTLFNPYHRYLRDRLYDTDLIGKRMYLSPPSYSLKRASTLICS
ncbi:hypothetical protein BGY98DRAFT_1007213, partial [Russula aff. rugulosa BPL654]